MNKMSLADVLDNLPRIQNNLGYKGQPRVLQQFTLPADLSERYSIAPGSKLVFAYMGTDEQFDATHHYLAWLENEGGVLSDAYFGPEDIPFGDRGWQLTDEGIIGCGQTALKPIDMAITWENGRPQAKFSKIGRIIELENVPEEAPMEAIFERSYVALPGIDYLLFGNPNLFLCLTEDLEPALLHLEPKGERVRCLHDSFYFNMEKSGQQLRQAIKDWAGSTIDDLEKLISGFVDANDDY